MGLLLKKYLWVVYFLLIAFCSYFLAKITSTFIRPFLSVDRSISLRLDTPTHKSGLDSRKVATLDNYKVITDRNIFDSREIKSDALPQATGAPMTFNPNSPAVLTTLPIKLISTFSMGDGTDPRSTATILNTQGGSGKAEVYKLDDQNSFAPGVKITKVLPSRIEFINSNRLEYVELEGMQSTTPSTPAGGALSTQPFGMDKVGKGPLGSSPSGGIKAAGGNKFLVDQAELDNAFSKLDVLFTQINVGPNLENGKPSGVRINRLSGQSIFAKLGLKAGDILKKINGEDFDMTKGMMLFGQLKEQKQFTIDVERRGQKMSFEYEVR
ncbi:MAG: hypothetical protein HYU97_08945 [Deltaproteobacteria bacterium]|nr:hypothetical protein [Deltaproteobacteria bacterium]